MKKYKVLDKVGQISIKLGVLILLFILCIDIDNSEIITILMCAAFGITAIVIGLILISFHQLEAAFNSLCIVIGAFIYSILKKMMSPFVVCDRIHRTLGSYKDTFKACKELHEEYLESLYYSEYNRKEDSKHE